MSHSKGIPKNADEEVLPGTGGGEAPSGCPFHATPAGEVPLVYGGGDVTYNDYLKVPELLKLQVPLSSPAHHDEMLFIIIHQAYELWFKLVLHEMENAIRYMDSGEPLRAHHFMNRINQVMKLLIQQIHILETMTPAEFLQFRGQLRPASGFQSIQFREIEFVAGLKDSRYFKHFTARPDLVETLASRLEGPDLRRAYYAFLRKQGFAVPESADIQEVQDLEGVIRADSGRTGGARSEEAEYLAALASTVQAIRPIYQEPARYSQLYILSESLVEFDECLALWREHHVRVVERVIGHKAGTGGSSGVSYLRSTTRKKCFPWLWQVRNYLE